MDETLSVRRRAEKGEDLSVRLLAWYDLHGRDLPWRLKGGGKKTCPADPYRVWLSEIMLQQTGVATVKPYFESFLRRWGDVHALAASDLDDVLHAWQGLGYYARARNLHACARQVSREMGGVFPRTQAELQNLPGIGPYSAAAIAAIAFDEPANVVDGNVERVIARLYALADPLPGARRKIKSLAAGLAPDKRPGDYAQGLMDLGSTICTPRAPSCPVCPWRGDCRALAHGAPESFPVKKPKSKRPVRKGVVFWGLRGDGAVLLRRRPPKGLLGGMMEFPSTDWRFDEWKGEEPFAQAPFSGDWQPLPGTVRHSFTHFHLELTVFTGQLKGQLREKAEDVKASPPQWLGVEKLSEVALPTLMKKVAAHVAASTGDGS